MIKKAAVAILMAFVTTGVVHADESEDRGFYLGLTAGKHSVDVDNVSGGDAGGLVGGFRIANGFAVEAAFTGSDLELDTIAGCIIELDTAAVYGAFRSSGKVYFKGRAGFLREELTSRDTCVGLVNGESDSGLSLGAGAGLRFGHGALEVEYTLVEQDVDQISASLIYNF